MVLGREAKRGGEVATRAKGFGVAHLDCQHRGADRAERRHPRQALACFVPAVQGHQLLFGFSKMHLELGKLLIIACKKLARQYRQRGVRGDTRQKRLDVFIPLAATKPNSAA